LSPGIKALGRHDPQRQPYSEMDAIKSNVEIREDGTLSGRTQEDDDLDANDIAWRERLKTWHMLRSFGRFAEIAKLSGQSIEDLNKAARFGDNEGSSDYLKYVPPKDFDWAAVRDAIDTLSGRRNRQAALKTVKAQVRKSKTIRKTRMVLAEIFKFGYEVFEDAAIEHPCVSNGATRKIRQRRKAGIPARYTPETQFKKLLKEAKNAAFDIFEPEDRIIEYEIGSQFDDCPSQNPFDSGW
jgi:hypothetical protein